MKQNRKDSIIQFLSKENKTTIRQLSNFFQVSEMTIRRDIAELESLGIVTRDNGKIFLNYFENVETNYLIRSKTNIPEKISIAKKACNFINDGDTIMLDSGTTITYLAEELGTFSNLTVITTDLQTLQVLLNFPKITTIFAGGNIIASSGMNVSTGYHTQEFLKQFFVKTAFIGVMSIDMDEGLFHSTADLALTKRTMINCANKKIVLVDSSKFNKRTSFKICNIEEIDNVITNTNPIVSQKITHNKNKYIFV